MLLKKIIQEQSNIDFLQDLCHHWSDGRIKLFTIFKTLQFCNQFDFLFNEGKYVELNIEENIIHAYLFCSNLRSELGADRCTQMDDPVSQQRDISVGE